MSSDRPKQPRKSGPQVRQEPTWRIKRTESALVKRYSRSELLSLFRASDMPQFMGEEDHLGEVVLREGVGPMFQAEQSFEHLLGEDLNARERPAAKMPDWYSEAEKKPGQEDRPKPDPLPDLQKRPSELKIPDNPPKPAELRKPAEPASKPIKVVIDKNAVIRNLPDDLKSFSLTLEVRQSEQAAPQLSEDFFTEEYSAIDREIEQRLKKEEEAEEAMPEWASAPLPPRSAPSQPPSNPQITPGAASFHKEQVVTQNAPRSQTLSDAAQPEHSSPPGSRKYPAAQAPASKQTVAGISPKSPPTPASQAQTAPVQSKAVAKSASSVPLFDSRAPKFHIDLLLDQIKNNDPFAKIIFQYGIPDSAGFMCCIPLSLPLERTWFYKDPQDVVQGPFTSIEMYNWNLVGYFSPSLQVSWRSNSLFLPLSELFRAPSDYWGLDLSMASLLKPIIPPNAPEPKLQQKQTLEINPNRAISSLLGIDTTKKTSSGWVAKTDSHKDSNRKR